jgi:hypothetical protein
MTNLFLPMMHHRSLRLTFRDLCEEVTLRFPKLKETIVPSILFVRFICPVIVSPQSLDLVDGIYYAFSFICLFIYYYNTEDYNRDTRG